MSFTITGIIIIAVLVFFIVFGIKNGLIKEIFDLFAFFLTWALTWIFYPYLAGALLKTPLYKSISDWIMITLNNNQLAGETMPEFFIGLPDFIKDSIVISSKQAFENLVSSTVDALAVLAINTISIIILFVAFRLLSILIRKLGKKINKIMLIGPVNMLLGGVFGTIKGIFFVYVAVMIISFFPTSKIYDRVAEDINTSYICNFLFNEDVEFMGLSPRYPMK